MSGQMSDVIVIDGDEYAVVEPSMPELLFDARAHGISPVMMHTANTRGVAARYRLSGSELLLSELQVGSIDEPPQLNGVTPTTDEHRQVWTYLKIGLPLSFTGDLIVGADPILELYTHSGFAPVWHYEKVFAYDIEGGSVRTWEDRSHEVAAYRAQHGAGEHDAEHHDENAFERFLSSIKIRLGLDD